MRLVNHVSCFVCTQDEKLPGWYIKCALVVPSTHSNGYAEKWNTVVSRQLLCLEITQQSSKDYLICAMIFPVGKVANVTHTTDISGQCLGSVHHRLI